MNRHKIFITTKEILFITGLFLVIVIFSPLQASAVMKGLSTEELVSDSELVLNGDVEKVESMWSDDGRAIISRASVIVNEVVRGKLVEERVVVEYDGGEVEDIGMRVSDVAPLIKGEKVILFLKSGKSRKASADIKRIVGKAQGKYTIGEDGIARKKGFSIVDGEKDIDNNIAADLLIDKIKKLK